MDRRAIIVFCALSALSASAAAQSSGILFETEQVQLSSFGYLRAGAGWGPGGRAQDCFQLPGARVKYRLGNECEIFVEPSLSLTLGDRENGPSVSLNLRGAATATEPNSYDELDTFLVEAWLGLAVFASEGPLEGAQVWGGQRYYRRDDTHIHDFYYLNGTGLGFGIEEIDLGFAQGALGMFEHSTNDLETALDEGSPYRRIEVRLDEIAVSDRIEAKGAIDLRFAKSGAETVADSGGLISFQMDREDARDGMLSMVVQAGWGAGHTLGYVSDEQAHSDDLGVRTLVGYLLNASEDFSVQATALAEWQSGSEDWVSAGLRPIWRIAGDMHIALEAGIDHVTPETGDTRTLGKVTTALEWKPTGPDFFDRPVVRLYATGAVWDRGAERAEIAPGYGGRNGSSVGVQVEQIW